MQADTISPIHLCMTYFTRRQLRSQLLFQIVLSGKMYLSKTFLYSDQDGFVLLLATVRQTCLNPLCCFIRLQKLFALGFWCLKLCEHALTVMHSLILYSWEKYKWTFSLSVSDKSLVRHCKYKTLNQIKNQIKALLFCHSTASCSNILQFVPFFVVIFAQHFNKMNCCRS